MGVAISTQAVVATMAIHHTAAVIVARDLHTMETIMGEAISTQAVVVTTDQDRHMEERATTVQGRQTRAILLTKAATSTRATAATTDQDHLMEEKAIAVRDHLMVEATAGLATHMKEDTTTAEVTLETDTRTNPTIVTIILTTETDGKMTSRLKFTRTTVTTVAIADIHQQTAQLTVHEIHMKATLGADPHQSVGTILEADRHQEAATLKADHHQAVQILEANHHLFPAHAPKLLMLGFPLITLPAWTMATRLSASLDAATDATSLWNVKSKAATRINGSTENAVRTFYGVKYTQ